MPGDRYGVRAEEVDEVADRIGAALAMEVERRESSDWGPYVLLKGGEGGEIRVYLNEDPMHDPDSASPEEEFFEPGHRGDRVLVEAQMFGEDWLRRLGEVRRSEFPGCALIRHRDG